MTSAERDKLLQDKADLEKKFVGGQNSLAELQTKLAQTVSELNTSVRALQQAQADLKAANRRADEAEKVQTNLQTEGVALMRSLEEMRPKIVELMDAKLDLGEKVDRLTRTVKARDDHIAQLELALEELREKHENVEDKRRELDTALEKERASSRSSATELQKGYVALQKELEDLRSTTRSLESERSEYRQLASRHLQEVDRLSSSAQNHMDLLASLRREVEERKQAQEEAHDLLSRAQGELEAIQAELSAKDEEIERLHAAVTRPATPGANSLDGEMLSALKQQHSLELSSAQSEIRALETAVYQAEARAHALQKQVAELEDQLVHVRPNSRTSQRPTPLPAYVSTRNIDHSDELRRASFNSVRSTNLRPSSPLSSFEGLSAETRHKRRVSLGMLKARIDSEAAAAKSHPPSRASPVQRISNLPTVVEHASAPLSPKRTSQYLDDSHIFWCHSCRGDLVIL